MAIDISFGMTDPQAVVAVGGIAAIIAIWGIISQRGITARQTTLEFIRNSESDRDMIQARATFNRVSRETAGSGQYATQPLSKEFKHIRMVLNEYEMISIGIQRGILDDKIYRRWHRSTVIRSWTSAAPFIFERRKNTGNEALWHEFEEMARWFRGNTMPRRNSFWGKFL